jgi:hypothetical protein
MSIDMIDLPGKSKYGFILQTDLKSVEVKSKKCLLIKNLDVTIFCSLHKNG